MDEDDDARDAARLLGEMWSPERVARLMECDPSSLRGRLRRFRWLRLLLTRDTEITSPHADVTK